MSVTVQLPAQEVCARCQPAALVCMPGCSLDLADGSAAHSARCPCSALLLWHDGCQRCVTKLPSLWHAGKP